MVRLIYFWVGFEIRNWTLKRKREEDLYYHLTELRIITYAAQEFILVTVVSLIHGCKIEEDFIIEHPNTNPAKLQIFTYTIRGSVQSFSGQKIEEDFHKISQANLFKIKKNVYFPLSLL